jgi:hypothetical protein
MLAEDSQALVVCDPRRLTGLPHRFLTPHVPGTQRDDRAMTGLLLMQRGKRGPDQSEPPRLDGVLMGDDHHIAMGVLGVEATCRGRHSLRKVIQ